jgi:hypothetical protein
LTPWFARVAVLSLLLACGGGDEPEEGGAASSSGDASEPAAETPPADGFLSRGAAVDRQLELWDDMITEVATIHDEATASAAVPRRSEIAGSANDVRRSIDPAAPVGEPTAQKSERLESMRDRYMQELTRISTEAPTAVSIIGDALASVDRAP